MNVVLNTNILIHPFNQIQPGAVALLAFLGESERAVSIVIWMEVMVGAQAANEAKTREFLRGFQLIRVDDAVMGHAVLIRRELRPKLPDAIIYASALATGRTLVTYSTRDFPPGTPSVFCPELK